MQLDKASCGHQSHQSSQVLDPTGEEARKVKLEIANPAPLGLLAFAMTTALLMYFDLDWHGAKVLVYGHAAWYGGAGQLLAGVFEILKGNTFGATAFSTYGCFWLAWSHIYHQSTNLGDSPDTSGEVLYLCSFGVLTLCFFVLTLRKNLCLVAVFGLLTCTFFLLAAGQHSDAAKKVGGAFGLATAVAATYTALAELLLEEWGYHALPGLKPLKRAMPRKGAGAERPRDGSARGQLDLESQPTVV